ncbi:MAG: ABC transporter permease subunit [Coriobacteriia bacterium]|nr:ABC transporter permease subunit [Coriobacteriia bacterium]
MRLLAVVLLAVLAFSAVGVAFADDVLKGTNLTLSQTSGGKSTRFTFTTLPKQPIEMLSLTYPEGFDVSAVKVDAVTLDGLKRIPVEVKTDVAGQKINLAFTPPVSAGFDMRVQIFDVVLPKSGGQFNVVVDYTSNGVTGQTSTPPFKTETFTTVQAVTQWLDEKPFVQKWNSLQFLNIFFKPQMIVSSVPLLFTGWLMSIALVVVAFPFAIAGGLLLAFMKMSKVWPVRFFSNIYINVIRGTPLFLQIFIAFVGLPIAGFQAPLFPTGVFVLALNSSAYLAEIFRAGIQSINRGQFEAASSLGMSYPQAMAFVIIPQTVKRVLPTMTSEFILLFKDTALLSAVGVFELMLYSNSLATRSGSLTPFVVAAVYYLLVTIPLINWVANLEHRLAIAEGGAAASSNDTTGRRRRWGWRPASAGPEAELQASVAEHESR